MSLAAFHGRCPTCGHEHRNELPDYAVGMPTKEQRQWLDKQFAEYAKTKPRLYGAIEQEVAKPQEPVAWVEVVDRYEGPYNFHGKELLDPGKHNLYAAPQPCQRCAELEAMIESQRCVLGALRDRIARADAKCSRLEAEVESLTEENDSRLETSIKQHARIMALEAEVERLNKVIAGYERDQAKTIAQQAERIAELEAERDDWKSRYESNLSVNQMHSDNNAEMLKFNAKLLSDIDALKEQNNAYAMLTKSQDSRLSEYYAKSQQYKDAVATLDSEKEANAILTQERDALAMQVAQMRDALEDMSSGWVYIRETHGDLYGVGWDRAQEKSRMALALHDLSAEIIKRHDAAIREEMLDMFRLKHRDYANEIAAELEKS